MTKLYEVADKVKALLVANKTSLGLHSVFYGDQEKLPGNFVACVEPDTKKTEHKGMARTVNREFVLYIILYAASVKSPEINRRDADVKAEDIETLLNQDLTLGGLLLSSKVTEVASGYSTKEGVLVRSNRITFTGTTTDRLPS